MFDRIKPWLGPLFRTFLAFFVTGLLAGLAEVDFESFEVSDLSVLGSLVLGAAGAAVNAVIIAAQKLAPSVPDPQPPAS